MSYAMVGYSKDQLLRPAKHLTLGPVQVARNKCHNCAGNIHSGNEFGLCRQCAATDPGVMTVKKIRRRQSAGRGYDLAAYDPMRPTCAQCNNYLHHRCGFGFPESDGNRLFAGECHLFSVKQSEES